MSFTLVLHMIASSFFKGLTSFDILHCIHVSLPVLSSSLPHCIMHEPSIVNHSDTLTALHNSVSGEGWIQVIISEKVTEFEGFNNDLH